MESELEITEFEKIIYNTHLRISRSRQAQPFKYRKEFSNIDDLTKICLKKISHFLAKFNHIKLEDFLSAPYDVYKDEKYFDLKYYTTLKATKTYAIFQNNKIYEDPDTEYHLNNVVESLNFIMRYCRDNNLLLCGYLDFIPAGSMPIFLTHLKEHKINIFTLLGLTGFLKKIKSLDAELVKFTIGTELYNRLNICHTKLLNSQKALKLISKGLTIVEKKLQQKR
jgi:hypothetical protein